MPPSVVVPAVVAQLAVTVIVVAFQLRSLFVPPLHEPRHDDGLGVGGDGSGGGTGASRERREILAGGITRAVAHRLDQNMLVHEIIAELGAAE